MSSPSSRGSMLLNHWERMYSGITKGLFKVTSLTKKPGLVSYTVELTDELCKNLHIGDSISVDGVCQTVTNLQDAQVSFQAMQETLEKTTLNELEQGCFVSIERSLRFGDEIGGHDVSGHVFGTGVIHQTLKTDNNLTLIIQCNQNWMKYILPKGFIAVDGSSLTVGETNPEQGLFYLHLIPETIKLTKFAHKSVNDRVNIEFDQRTKTIVDTVERLLNTITPSSCK
mgnify:CR=1 FL=1